MSVVFFGGPFDGTSLDLTAQDAHDVPVVQPDEDIPPTDDDGRTLFPTYINCYCAYAPCPHYHYALTPRGWARLLGDRR